MHRAAVRAPAECSSPTGLLGSTDLAFLLDTYRGSLASAAATEPRLAGVVADTLATPGGLVRAQLAFATMAWLGVERARAGAVAIGIESFHTASLLLDDLPSMDDGQLRRGRPCAHVVHGEAATILGALGFINNGYALVWSVLATLPARRRERARRLLDETLGLHGVLNGQALDLAFGEAADRGEQAVQRAVDGKSVAPVRLSLVLGAIVGGVREPRLALYDALARAWGRSYQTLDDFTDCDATSGAAGKTTARDARLGRPNLPLTVGRERAIAVVRAQLARGRQLLARIDRDGRCLALHAWQGRLEQQLERVVAVCR